MEYHLDLELNIILLSLKCKMKVYNGWYYHFINIKKIALYRFFYGLISFRFKLLGVQIEM